MQQAIIWIKKPIRVAGGEISILVADVITEENDEASILVADVITTENDEVVCKLGSGDILRTSFDTMIEGEDMDPILCIITNGDGGFIDGVADIRVIDPADIPSEDE